MRPWNDGAARYVSPRLYVNGGFEFGGEMKKRRKSAERGRRDGAPANQRPSGERGWTNDRNKEEKG